MEGESVARDKQVGIGAMVLTVHHASVPPRSMEKWREMVHEKAEKLQHQSTFPKQTFPCHNPGGKVISAAQRWGKRKLTNLSNSWDYVLIPPSFAAVCGGATPRHDGMWLLLLVTLGGT